MVKLDLADEQLEVIIITNCVENNIVNIRISNDEVVLKSIIRYQLPKASSFLAKMTSNIGKQNYCRKVLMAEVVKSMLLFAAPIWKEAVDNDMNRKRVSLVYRAIALKMRSGYRTKSGGAACVITGAIPIHLSANDAHCFWRR